MQELYFWNWISNRQYGARANGTRQGSNGHEMSFSGGGQGMKDFTIDGAGPLCILIGCISN